MAESDKKPVTLEEILVSSLAQTDTLAKLLIERSLWRSWWKSEGSYGPETPFR
jgi:hypothetical protein